MDNHIRLAAFQWLEQQVMLFEDEILPRNVLEEGFIYQGKRITLMGPKGIWKPKSIELPISITTTSESPYKDEITKDNFINYRYRGNDPHHSDNLGLREAMNKQVPLIYFLAIAKGKYLAAWPSYIVGDNIEKLTFIVAVDEARYLTEEELQDQKEVYVRRSYLTSTIKTRLHQRSFREKVLTAYQNQCALCRLRHRELLDAAHIIPDPEELGQPIIQNGLSLCKIHHAAFDNNIIGITPDYIIKIRGDILEEIDGPMLKYGIQSLEDKKIILPSHKKHWPDRDRLDQRYEIFRNAV
ncbi:MAG: HNH endonuclease [Bacteroidota bacterium]